MAETTPGSSRVVVRPIAASDIVGRRGFIHIETVPSHLRIRSQWGRAISSMPTVGC
jgi:hypothetical protein